MPSLKYYASRMHARGCLDQEDLIQAAALALMRTREKFDPKRGIKWATYALGRAKGAMLDALRDIDHIPRVQRRRLKAAGLEGEKVLSIDWQGMELDQQSWIGILETSAENGDIWQGIYRRLGERTGRVLEMYFREDRTLKTIGRLIGLSESRTCQLLARGLQELRQVGFAR